jgi:hypothetical protein
MTINSVTASFTRRSAEVAEWLTKNPWVGWAAWIVFCISILVQTGPRRFGSTFGVYLDFANRLWSRQPLYDATTLDGFNYWPASLLIYIPLLKLHPVVAGWIMITIAMAVFTWTCVKLLDALLPQDRPISAARAAGIFLLINIPAAWFNFKYIQAQILMTSGMMLGATAMMRGRWHLASLWIFFAAVMKPLAIVMLLLCGAVQPRMRLPLIGALIAGLLLPFAFIEWSYLVEQFRAWMLKLSFMAQVRATDWPYQADFQTMLDTVHIVVPPNVALAIRLAAAFVTLALAWRISKIEGRTIFPLGVLLLSGCYITLFGPRNEFLSFLVLTPGLTALAFILFGRDAHDLRGWLLIAAVLVLGFSVSFAVDRVTKPFVVTLIFIWLIWLTLRPQRWRDLLAEPSPPKSRGS